MKACIKYSYICGISGSLILGIVAGFVTNSWLVGIFTPFGILLCLSCINCWAQVVAEIIIAEVIDLSARNFIVNLIGGQDTIVSGAETDEQ